MRNVQLLDCGYFRMLCGSWISIDHGSAHSLMVGLLLTFGANNAKNEYSFNHMTLLHGPVTKDCLGHSIWVSWTRASLNRHTVSRECCSPSSGCSHIKRSCVDRDQLPSYNVLHVLVTFSSRLLFRKRSEY